MVKTEKSILVVEDSKDLREMFVMYLSNSYQVSAAATISQAFELLREQTFDLILLDLKLPDGGGLDVLERIKGEYNRRVIMITAHGSIQNAVQAIQMGAADFIQKPVKMDKLLEAIDSVFEMLENKNYPVGLTKQCHDKPDIHSLEECERCHIIKVLQYCQNNKTRAAKLLNIDRSTLYKKITGYYIKVN